MLGHSLVQLVMLIEASVGGNVYSLTLQLDAYLQEIHTTSTSLTRIGEDVRPLNLPESLAN